MQEEYYHKYNHDQKSVDNFMSQELLKLSLTDRNAILEETHGVRCIAPEETPGTIKTALDELATEIEKLPIKKKSAYLHSQNPQEFILPDGTKTTSAYVNTDDFRLRFLRASLFDAQQAAKLMVKYLEVALDFFGEFALFRPVNLNDFTKEEMRVFRTGMGQFLPFRDRYGRRVFVVFQSERIEEVPQTMRMKILFYMTYSIATGDLDLQRKGMVAILWSQGDMKYKFKVTPEKCSVQMHEFAPIRLSAVHICTPDTSFYRFARGVWAIGFGRNAFLRIRFHMGTSVELRYVLQSYGINMDQMPITCTGTIKQQNFKQWMRARQHLEMTVSNNRRGRNSSEKNSNPISIIECPGLNDIIFRKGTSVMSHPGNVFFRSSIQTLYQETETCTTARSTKILTKKLIDDLRNKNGRVLVWYQGTRYTDSWWTELKDEEKICTKIENLVRELKFSKNKYQTINRASDNPNSSGSEEPQYLFIESPRDGCFANHRGQKRPLESGDENDGCFSR